MAEGREPTEEQRVVSGDGFDDRPTDDYRSEYPPPSYPPLLQPSWRLRPERQAPTRRRRARRVPPQGRRPQQGRLAGVWNVSDVASCNPFLP